MYRAARRQTNQARFEPLLRHQSTLSDVGTLTPDWTIGVVDGSRALSHRDGTAMFGSPKPSFIDETRAVRTCQPFLLLLGFERFDGGDLRQRAIAHTRCSVDEILMTNEPSKGT